MIEQRQQVADVMIHAERVGRGRDTAPVETPVVPTHQATPLREALDERAPDAEAATEPRHEEQRRPVAPAGLVPGEARPVAAAETALGDRPPRTAPHAPHPCSLRQPNYPLARASATRAPLRPPPTARRVWANRPFNLRPHRADNGVWTCCDG